MLNFLALFLKIWSGFLPLPPLKLLYVHTKKKKKKDIEEAVKKKNKLILQH